MNVDSPTRRVTPAVEAAMWGESGGLEAVLPDDLGAALRVAAHHGAEQGC
jgi:hypothetical protein